MKIIVFMFPIVLFSVFLGIKLIFPTSYVILIQEDSVIEYLQAIFYCASSLLSLFTAFKFFKNKWTLLGILYCLLAIGLLFVTLEEISWGQRIFNIKNPVFFEQNNFKKEITIHNLNAVQPYLHRIFILIGAYGTFSWLIGWPIKSRRTDKIRRILEYIFVDWHISSYFFFTFLIYTTFDYISQPHKGSFLLFRDQEPIELLLSLGFLAFLVNNYTKFKFHLINKPEE